MRTCQDHQIRRRDAMRCNATGTRSHRKKHLWNLFLVEGQDVRGNDIPHTSVPGKEGTFFLCFFFSSENKESHESHTGPYSCQLILIYTAHETCLWISGFKPGVQFKAQQLTIKKKHFLGCKLYINSELVIYLFFFGPVPENSGNRKVSSQKIVYLTDDQKMCHLNSFSASKTKIYIDKTSRMINTNKNKYWHNWTNLKSYYNKVSRINPLVADCNSLAEV